MRKWTKEEIEDLKTLMAANPNLRNASVLLERTREEVAAKAEELKLCKVCPRCKIRCRAKDGKKASRKVRQYCLPCYKELRLEQKPDA